MVIVLTKPSTQAPLGYRIPDPVSRITPGGSGLYMDAVAYVGGALNRSSFRLKYEPVLRFAWLAADSAEGWDRRRTRTHLA